MTKEEIEKIEPSKERVMKQLDDLGIFDEHERDCFYKGVLFCKGYLYKDFQEQTEYFRKLLENRDALISCYESKKCDGAIKNK